MENTIVKHYLNKKLRPKVIKNELTYPVYVRVSCGRKNDRFKSQWIIHTCSEHDFYNNKEIIDLINYETYIISDILSMVNNIEKISIKVLLRHSMDSLTCGFIDSFCGIDTVKDEIISFLSKKTGLSKSILNPYFRIELPAFNWVELIEKEVFSKKIKELISYFVMLLEFEEIYFKRTKEWNFIMEVGEVFNYYQWKDKNGKELFLKYAESRKLLPFQNTLKITSIYDKKLDEDYKWRIKYSMMEVE